jgi:UDP-GlcNAc:undecaprenyl-phosphate/decaprenyl-phosphate GlcNAc-1-phosphate transferase
MLIYLDLFLSLALSFTIAFLLIPKIIQVSITKKLFDVPNHRSAAKHVVPTLGGIAIFAGFRIAQVISLNNFDVNELKYLSISVIAMLFVGLMDDLVGLPARSKFIIQLVMAIYLVILGHFRITNFHGILGINEISFITGTIFSVIAIVGIINAVNLIDGLDGLASGIGILVSLVYGTWFFIGGDYVYAITCFSLVGSLIAFFLYNVFGTTNKIFMGDTGSLILGTIFAILTLHFNEFNPSANGLHGLPALSLAIIIVPVIDTSRIFVIRLWQGKSPFSPDMNHIHHQVLRLTGSHLYSSLTIIAVNAMFILLSFSLIDTFGNNLLFFILLVLGFIFAGIPSWILKIHNKNSGTKPENNSIQDLTLSGKEIKKIKKITVLK